MINFIYPVAIVLAPIILFGCWIANNMANNSRQSEKEWKEICDEYDIDYILD